MFTKVFCYHENEDLKSIADVLRNQKDQFIVICDTEESKNAIKENFNAKTIDEFFPIYSDKTFAIYQNTKNALLDYQKAFSNTKFGNYPIGIGLLHYIKTDLLLIEKIRKILEEKENFVFLFRKVRYVNFLVQKIVESQSYQNDGTVHLFKGNKTHTYKQLDSISGLEKANKISKYKNAFSLYSSNISKEKNKVSALIRLSEKTVPMVLRLAKTKVYEKNPEGTSQILKKVREKIAGINIQSGFFLSSDRKDLLESHYGIFERFSSENIKFMIFTTDPITLSFLDGQDLPVTNLFEESYALANVLRNMPDAKALQEEIEAIAKKQKMLLLYNEKLNPEVFDGIYRTIALMMIIDACLGTLKAEKLVFLEGTLLGMIVAYVAGKIGIPTVSVETLIVDKNAISSMLYKADKVCIYGVQGQETLAGFGISNDRIEVTGNPRYDYVKDFDEVKSKELLEQRYKIDTKPKLIVVAMSRWHYNDEQWMSDFVKFADKNGWQVIIKVHPRYKTRQDENQAKIDFIQNECKGLRFLVTFDVDLNLLMSAAEVIISDYSNVGVEGVLLGKPVINVNFAREDLNNAQNYHKIGAVLYTERYEDLKEFTESMIKEGKYVEGLKEGRAQMISRYNVNNDGLASERIFRLLLKS